MSGNNPPEEDLRPETLQAMLTLSQLVSGAADNETVLAGITRIVRPIFIFDNLVLYEPSANSGLEPTYARAVGRGRCREADLAWGEMIANEAFQSGAITHHVEELNGAKTDRTDIRHLLGLPLKLGKTCNGALVFIRFGGPPYLPQQIRLAEFIALNFAQLLERRRLGARVAELEARRRLDSLQDDFVALISHELLTPLGVIKGYATTLLREDTQWDDEARREFLTFIDEEADRLHELLDNLMDSSRLKTGTLSMSFQPTRLDTLLRDLVLRAKYGHETLQIDLQVRSPGLNIMADPTRLAQVFDNILGNAAKYAKGSPVTITLELHDETAQVSIVDHGPGIPPEHLEKIFQRFYRVPGPNSSARGSGLGLYICHKIVEAHHGSIQAFSTVDQGTTFLVSLPLEPGSGTKLSGRISDE
ncbi:MAG: ATP-binding protein [Chloroflexota bacterium]